MNPVEALVEGVSAGSIVEQVIAWAAIALLAATGAGMVRGLRAVRANQHAQADDLKALALWVLPHFEPVEKDGALDFSHTLPTRFDEVDRRVQVCEHELSLNSGQSVKDTVNLIAERLKLTEDE